MTFPSVMNFNDESSIIPVCPLLSLSLNLIFTLLAETVQIFFRYRPVRLSDFLDLAIISSDRVSIALEWE